MREAKKGSIGIEKDLEMIIIISRKRLNSSKEIRKRSIRI